MHTYSVVTVSEIKSTDFSESIHHQNLDFLHCNLCSLWTTCPNHISVSFLIPKITGSQLSLFCILFCEFCCFCCMALFLLVTGTWYSERKVKIIFSFLNSQLLPKILFNFECCWHYFQCDEVSCLIGQFRFLC